MSVESIHLSYLLRLWRGKDVGDKRWRASLRNVRTGEEQGFRNVTDLCIYLQSMSESTEPSTIDQSD